MEWWGWALIALGLIVVIFLVIMYFQFVNTFTFKKKMNETPLPNDMFSKYIDVISKNKEYFETVEKEEVYIKSFDGFNLKAHYVKGSNPKKLLIFFHGFKSSYKTDLTNAKQYIDKGYSLLMIEQRAHGGSDGKYISFGVLERVDCKMWVDYAVNRFGNDVEILLVGVSMGAATIMMAANLGLAKNVVGMICDCGFTTPKEEIAYCIRHYYKLPSFIVIDVLNLYCKIFAKFSLSGANSATSLSESDIPILMVHGDGDDFVPYEYSVKNFAACQMENKELVTIKCDVHACSYLENTTLYQQKVDNFLKSINF